MIKTSLAILVAGVLLAGCVYDRDQADGYSSYERDRARDQAWARDRERERARERELAWERDRERERAADRARERAAYTERDAYTERTRPGEPARLHTGPALSRPAQSAAMPPAVPPGPVQPDRVRSQDLANLSPASGTTGPDADTYRPARATPSPTRLTSGHQRIFVQAASFVTREQAERARRAVAQYGPTRIYTAYVDDQLRYRVRVGPMSTPERSERVRSALVRRGYGDAIIIRD